MVSKRIRALMIEDNPADARLVVAFLNEIDDAGIGLDHAGGLAEGLERLAREPFDVVLLDLNLADSSGLDSLHRVHAANHYVPVVVLTSLDTDQLALKAVHAGAEDYLPKGRLEPHLLVRAIRHAVERAGHRHADRKLHESEARFRAIVETASDWIWEIDAEGVYTYSSPRVRNLLGYEPEEVLGRSPFDFMPPDEARRVADQLRRAAAGRRPIDRLENVNLHKDGRRVVLETSGVPVFDDMGRFSGYRGIDRDITESKEAEEALRRSEQRYRQLLDAVTNYTYTVTMKGGVPVATQHGVGCERTTGYSPEQFAADPYLWYCMVHPDDRDTVQHHIARVLARQDVPPIEHRILHRDGSVRWVRDTIVQRGEHNGLVAHYDGLVEDITERKQAELALREREAHLLAAQRIQERLLPVRPPDLPGFDVAGATFPAEFTAGDYFDYLPMTGGAVGFVVGDVSGHGFGPALLTASVRAYLRSIAQTDDDLGHILSRANAILYEETEEGHFATLILVRLDPARRTLAFANAGHPSALVLSREGSLKATLRSQAIPLAVLPATTFPMQGPIPLAPGDVVLMATDGIHEARDAGGTPLGMQPILESLQAHRRKQAADIVRGLYQRVVEHCHPASPIDDITAVVIKVLDE